MKIFGIGLSKTGTTSLAAALSHLGYDARHRVDNLTEINRLDAVTDEIATIYRDLDATHPGSKFILTLRPLDSWLRSCRHHFRQPLPQSDPSYDAIMQLYGTTQFEEARFRAGYQRHVAQVRDYFTGREGDLLELDLFAGEGWEALCTYLEKPLPTVPFPKENVSWSFRRLVRRLHRWFT